jgi:hypothetical protein
MFSCPACGSKQGGFFRLCGLCKYRQEISESGITTVDLTEEDKKNKS